MDSRAFGLILASAVLHASWNFAARKVSGNLGVVWLGLCLAGAASAPFAWAFATVSLAAASCVAASGFLNAVAFGATAHAYEEGEISLVYPAARGTGVAGAALAARFLLGETFSPLGAAGIACVCAGIAVLGLGSARKAGQARSLLLALGVGSALAVASVIDKLGVGLEHPVAYVWGQYSCAAAFLAPYAWGRRSGQCREAWGRLRPASALIGLGSIASYLLALFAFRVGPLGYTVAAREFAVVLGAALGVLVLKEACPPVKAAGVLAILSGLVLIRLA